MFSALSPVPAVEKKIRNEIEKKILGRRKDFRASPFVTYGNPDLKSHLPNALNTNTKFDLHQYLLQSQNNGKIMRYLEDVKHYFEK